MKTILLCVALALASRGLGGNLYMDGEIARYVATNPLPGNERSELIQRASVRPFRLVGGEVVNLVPLFRYLELPFNGDDSARPMNDWVLVSGKVLQAKAGGGMLIDSELPGKIVFVTNYPFPRADGDSFVAYVRNNGTHEYQSVAGSTKTVRSYDHGKLITGKAAAELVAQVEADDKKHAEENQRRAEEIRVASEKAKAERQAKLNEAVRKFRAEQAAKGEAEK